MIKEVVFRRKTEKNNSFLWRKRLDFIGMDMQK